MGSSIGSQALSAGGCPIYVQDEATSVVWGMPGFVAKAGLAEKILPIGDVAREILSVVRRGHGTQGLRRNTLGSIGCQPAPQSTSGWLENSSTN